MPKGKSAKKRELTLAAVRSMIRTLSRGRGKVFDLKPTVVIGWCSPATRPNWARVVGKDLKAAWDRKTGGIRAKKG